MYWIISPFLSNNSSSCDFTHSLTNSASHPSHPYLLYPTTVLFFFSSCHMMTHPCAHQITIIGLLSTFEGIGIKHRPEETVPTLNHPTFVVVLPLGHFQLSLPESLTLLEIPTLSAWGAVESLNPK